MVAGGRDIAGHHPPMIRALILSAGPDTGGQSIRFKQAADQHARGRLAIRAVSASRTYMRYPFDVLSAGNAGAVRRLFEAADVVHANNDVIWYLKLDRRRRKPLVVHHHGSKFRSDPRHYLQVGRRLGAVLAVSTHDLLRAAPDELTWLPQPHDIGYYRSLRPARRAPGPIRIASAPTNRHIKSTDALEQAVAALQAEGLPVELDIIAGVTWEACLRRKATADIYFDQVKLGYGNNAIEAWGLGLPVIAGADDETLARMVAQFGSLPFLATTEAGLRDALRALATDAEARRRWAKRGEAHALRYHDSRPALASLEALYWRAMDR